MQEVLDRGDLLLVDLPEHEVTRADLIPAIQDFQPDLVIHAAAMTDGDGCERGPEAAFRVNEVGTSNVAEARRLSDAALL